MTSTWDKVHQPCPICNSSDAVGVNEDGSAKCFSCDTFMPNYKESCEGKNMEVAHLKFVTLCKLICMFHCMATA